MRDGDSKTPARKQQSKGNKFRESSGKKMVQARLPFKVITSGLTSPSSVATVSALVEPIETAAIVNRHHGTNNAFGDKTACQDTRKRRLSYAEEHEVINCPTSVSKENLTSTAKKLKRSTTSSEEDVIMLIESEDEVTPEGPQEKVCKEKNTTCSSPKTPLARSQCTGAPKSAGSSGSGTQSRRDSPRLNTPKLQIKLPISNKKRRKSKRKPTLENKASPTEIIIESSDDAEIIVGELNPQKRPRVDEAKDGDKKVQSVINYASSSPEKEATDAKIFGNSTDEEQGEEGRSEITIVLNNDSNESNTMSIDGESSELPSKSVKNLPSSESDPMPGAYALVQDLLYEIIDKSLEEALKEPSSKSPQATTPTGPCAKHRLYGLTPKQQMLKEKRRMLREIKENKLREEKLQKQREKEQAKRRERDEKEEQKRREREEREEQKRKEREERERKRLAEIEAKTEEKRKRNEAKEEELRKKDEERKRKEQEKAEAENKKKKAAEAFTKFFVSKTTRSDGVPEAHQPQAANNVASGGRSGESVETLAFRPFQIKGDMKLAPVCRKLLTNNARVKLDSFVGEKTPDASNDGVSTPQLYLNELKTGQVIPVKWRRLTNNTKEERDDDDVVCIDELECAAQAIVEDAGRPLERYRAKFYKFYENRRPPYFGTWRKKTNVITPRCPLALDKTFFDYDVDSDLEWEEEEPGESLDGSDDEKEKESEDDDYEVDNEWFVPHGHLSEEELQDDDENGVGEGTDREAQKAKLQMLQQEFAQEMKRKTEKIKPRLVGCIWQDRDGNKPESCPAVIWENLNKHAMLYTTPLLVEEPSAEAVGGVPEDSATANATATPGEKLKPISLSDTMLKDLIRLIHGNRHSKVFLIKEFIAHVEKTEEAIKNGDVRGPLKSAVRDKIDEFAVWQVVDLNSINGKSKKNKKKLCWLVSESALRKYDLEHLELHNKWSYTLQPKFLDTYSKSSQILEGLVDGETSNKKQLSPLSLEETTTTTTSKAEGINMFTKVSTAEEEGPKLDIIAKDALAEKTSSEKSSKNQITALAAPIGTPKPILKKRVPLLMSTARGQQIPTSEKNALISQFLKKSKAEKDAVKKDVQENATETVPEMDGVVVLD